MNELGAINRPPRDGIFIPPNVFRRVSEASTIQHFLNAHIRDLLSHVIRSGVSGIILEKSIALIRLLHLEQARPDQKRVLRRG